MEHGDKIYKGQDLVEHQLSLIKKLIGEEVKPKQKILIPHKGGDGNVYGVVREGHNYFIKVGQYNDDGKLLEESFDYIGGLQNKAEKFTSYEAATKRLNGKILSLSETYNNQPDKDPYTSFKGNTNLDIDNGEVDSDESHDEQILFDSLEPNYIDEVEELLSVDGTEMYSLPMKYDNLRGDNVNSWKKVDGFLVNSENPNLKFQLTPGLESEIQPIEFDLHQFDFDDSDEIASRKIENDYKYDTHPPDIFDEGMSLLDEDQTELDFDETPEVDFKDNQDVNLDDFNPKYVMPDDKEVDDKEPPRSVYRTGSGPVYRPGEEPTPQSDEEPTPPGSILPPTDKPYKFVDDEDMRTQNAADQKERQRDFSQEWKKDYAGTDDEKYDTNWMYDNVERNDVSKEVTKMRNDARAFNRKVWRPQSNIKDKLGQIRIEIANAEEQGLSTNDLKDKYSNLSILFDKTNAVFSTYTNIYNQLKQIKADIKSLQKKYRSANSKNQPIATQLNSQINDTSNELFSAENNIESFILAYNHLRTEKLSFNITMDDITPIWNEYKAKLNNNKESDLDNDNEAYKNAANNQFESFNHLLEVLVESEIQKIKKKH